MIYNIHKLSYDLKHILSELTAPTKCSYTIKELFLLKNHQKDLEYSCFTYEYSCFTYILINILKIIFLVNTWYNSWLVPSSEKRLIDWCLIPTLAVFELYRGMNKLYILDTSSEKLFLQWYNSFVFKKRIFFLPF